MSSLAYIADILFGGLVSILLWPFSSAAPLWGLLFVSAVAGVLLLKVYGLVSNQAAIRKVKNDIGGGLLEVVLYRHDVKTVLLAQFGLLGRAGKYFLLAVPPILVLMIPCLLLLAQLNLRFGYRSAAAGEPLIVSAVATTDEVLDNVRIVPQENVSATPPVRIRATREAFWRVTPQAAVSEYRVRLGVGDDAFEFTLNSQKGGHETLWSTKWWNWLLYPGSERLKGVSGQFQEVSVSYPASSFTVFGVEMNWVVVFFVISLISGLVASRFMGVEI